MPSKCHDQASFCFTPSCINARPILHNHYRAWLDVEPTGQESSTLFLATSVCAGFLGSRSRGSRIRWEWRCSNRFLAGPLQIQFSQSILRLCSHFSRAPPNAAARHVRMKSNAGITPLYAASQNGHQAVVALLRQHGATE